MRRRTRWWVAGACALVGVVAMTACSKDEEAPTVLVIGDSLTVGAEIGGLGSDGTITVEAKEGRRTDAATDVAKEADLYAYERIVVAVGTNDYLDSEADYAAKVDAMMAVLGSDVPVTWVNVDTGTPKLAPAAAGVNAALTAAADRHPNLTIADWDAYLAARDDRDELRAGDQVHDSPEGYRVRAAWMAGLADP